jgi:class 3 adenylate cyclase
MGTVIICVLMTGGLMFWPLEFFSEELETETMMTFNESVHHQVTKAKNFSATAANSHYSNILKAAGRNITRSLFLPVERAVDTIWGTMRAQRALDSSYNASAPDQRRQLELRSLVELQDQLEAATAARANHVYVGFAGEQMAGAILVDRDHPQLIDSAGDANGSFVLDTILVDPVTYEQRNTTSEVWPGPTNRVWYQAQADVAQSSPQDKPRIAWTPIYRFPNGETGLTFTKPVAYCGNYSCLEGVVGADITLGVLDDVCHNAWEALQEYSFYVNLTNSISAVFIVQQASKWGEQVGTLIGQSHTPISGNMTNATDADREIIRRTADLLLNRYGSWDAEGLRQEMHFTVDDHNQECNHGNMCLEIGTASVSLDIDSRWLIVMVSSVDAFSSLAFDIEMDGQVAIEQMQETMQERHTEVRILALIVFVAMIVLSIGMGFGLTMMVVAPLRQLGRLMHRLGQLDFGHETSEFDRLASGRRALVKDVVELQDSFCRLSRAIETFSKFVPEPVVRNLVRSDEKATRLHVDKRVVTIMFSDIQGFTSLSETLPLNDLVFMLTLYLSTMTRIVESYGGVVAEILGDGLLIFWNSGPEPCQDHQRKALGAALAMQQAMGPLNSDFATIDLPQLFVRIGVHTGEVLCGNIGSDRKMKFGCMGDPVNLASRLEGLCKTYGVGIICSGDTHAMIGANSGIISRKLDLAQVKGRAEPVLLYEVMGEDPQGDCVLPSQTSASESDALSDATDNMAMTRCASTAAGAVSAQTAVHKITEVLQNGRGLSHLGGLKDHAKTLANKRMINGTDVTWHVPGTETQSLEAQATKKRIQSRRYEQALDAYQRGHFAQARDLAKKLLNDFPKDAPSEWLTERAGSYLGGPEGNQVVGLSTEELAAWTGVSVIREK